LEGYAPNKHLEKADGSSAHVDERLSFKVIEFDRNDKRIIVSHSKFVRDSQEDERREKDKGRKRGGEEKKGKSQLSKVQKNVEKTTLGELDVLSQLKEQMESDQKATTKTEKKAKAAKSEKVEEPEVQSDDAASEDATEEKTEE
jgi:small subunit ribosomal protein S1